MKYSTFFIRECMAGLTQLCRDLDALGHISDEDGVRLDRQWYLHAVQPVGVELSEMSYNIVISATPNVVNAYMDKAMNDGMEYLPTMVRAMYTFANFGHIRDHGDIIDGTSHKVDAVVSNDFSLFDIIMEKEKGE